MRKTGYLSILILLILSAILVGCSLLSPEPTPVITPPVVDVAPTEVAAVSTEAPPPLPPTSTAPPPATFTPVPVEIALPDLEMIAASITYSEYVACFPIPDGVVGGLSVSIINNGSADAGPFVVDVDGVTQTVDGMAAQSTITLFFASWAGNAPIINVDLNNQVEESNESNNLFQDPIPVPTPPPACTPTPLPAQPLGGINLEFVVGGLAKPLYLTHADDSRLFVVQQTGQIKIIENGAVLPTSFLDISDRVNTAGNEQGLLGLAFHPEYQFNGRFFVNYSDADGSSVISEFQVSADPNLADISTERQVMKVGQPYRNHNGGHLAFGLDGYLYIGLGDGGSQNDPENHAQNLNSLLGKILRIDIDNGDPYAVPGDNPFVADASARNEIWSYGWRNPWRFSFDQLTGDIYIGDVGQNEWEEISFQPANTGGLNFGWRIYEGSDCYLDDCSTPNLVPPIGQYNHAAGHCSVTGGYVYRGVQQPAMVGNYIFADYCSGTFWRLFPSGAGSWDQAEIGRVNFLISSFGEGANGELYVINQGGEVYRLTAPGNQTN